MERPLVLRPTLTGEQAERLATVLLRRAGATSEIEQRRMQFEVWTHIEERYEIVTEVARAA
jgi:hypothetical protein